MQTRVERATHFLNMLKFVPPRCPKPKSRKIANSKMAGMVSRASWMASPSCTIALFCVEKKILGRARAAIPGATRLICSQE